MLSFVNRMSREFISTSNNILLYNSLIRPFLEYTSPVWSPYTLAVIKLIESVQHKCLRRLAYLNSTPMSMTEHDYAFIMSHFSFQTLSSRRRINDIIFLYKIINNQISSPVLFNNICFRIPTRSLHNYNFFYISYCRTSIYKNSTLIRICNTANQFCTDVDLCAIPISNLRTVITQRFL